MMKKNVLAVACTLAIAMVIVGLGLSTDAFAAVPHVPLHVTGLVVDGIRDLTSYMAIPLVAMRANLDDLQKRAAEKLLELKDDTAPDAARTIEADHKKLLEEIEKLKGDIRQAEVDEETQQGDRNNPPSNTEGARAADILDLGTRAGMQIDAIQAALRNGVSVEAFRSQAFDFMAQQASRSPSSSIHVIRDEAEARRSGMMTAMAFRLGGMDQPTGDEATRARSFMDNHDVVEFAAAAIGHRGAARTVREREDILVRAFHSTSDFPAIFSSAINTVLERRYALAQPTYRRISRRRDFVDFRPHYAVSVGEFPMLEKLTEAGEIKFGTFGEGKEQIAVAPYAKGIRVTRQMMVNDRLNALGEVLGGYGRTVARFEELTFYTMMLSANTKLADGKTVFHADHANLAGSGSAISVASIGAGKAAMRKQKGLDDAILNLQPSILLVSPDKETEALQYLAPITANDSVKVNPHVGTLEPVVSAQLTGNAWYLFASPDEAAVYQWGLLDGYGAPRIRFDEPFGTQGLAMTVEHDFGVGAIDFRGGYKNPGE
ncbi:Mu-like prophage major head subunit gpT family protein [Agrobacterium tumefaciens]|uniref:phage major capsid protein n=1 Tax=Agrobacterium tumefaciens TaxID=358 RepID=UPI001571A06E|nr:Mu-like prophage major head subunit gpT family protein [Agrobacterium tumefaciens]WCK12351.1 Mu-like prophage major head subunit gpT family protein [Agrobacterium tumefaciens]